MLKEEFEKMIGKAVTVDTYNQYNDMYMTTPESVSKQEFINMLNIESIPEDPAAIERRQARQAFIDDIKHKIDDLRAEINWHKDDMNRYKSYAALNDTDKNFWLHETKIKKARINVCECEIRRLKSVL